MAPRRMGRSRRFFCRYAGSGFVIQYLTRFQWAPRRNMASRRVGALKNPCIKPTSRQTSAHSDNVHVLWVLPYVRGLWCKIVWTHPRLAARTGWTMRSTQDGGVKHAALHKRLDRIAHRPDATVQVLG